MTVNTVMFTDEDFSSSAVTDGPLQINKHLENCGLSDYHTPNSNLDVNSQPSTSGLTQAIHIQKAIHTI
jgi:hypothetical protein